MRTLSNFFIAMALIGLTSAPNFAWANSKSPNLPICKAILGAVQALKPTRPAPQRKVTSPSLTKDEIRLFQALEVARQAQGPQAGRHPYFTTLAREPSQNVFRSLQNQEFFRPYFEILDSTTEFEARQGGVSSQWLARLGFHLSTLLALKPEMIGTFSVVQIYSTVDQHAREKLQYIVSDKMLFLPMLELDTIEGTVTKLAHRVSIAGVLPGTHTIDGNPDYNSLDVYNHDIGHLTQWIQAVAEVPMLFQVERATYVSYRQMRSSMEILKLSGLDTSALPEMPKDFATKTPPVFNEDVLYRRLQNIVYNLKDLPTEERRAGFFLFFVIVHEAPKAFLHDLADSSQPPYLTVDDKTKTALANTLTEIFKDDLPESHRRPNGEVEFIEDGIRAVHKALKGIP